MTKYNVIEFTKDDLKKTSKKKVIAKMTLNDFNTNNDPFLFQKTHLVVYIDGRGRKTYLKDRTNYRKGL